MSNIRRDYQKSSTNNGRRNNKDDKQSYHRKRTNSIRSNDHSNSQQTLNTDAKVYVGNVPTDNLTDGELLTFFKPFGKISDIRVYKGYIFVQYDRIEDATKLIEQGQNSLILKGNKLDILPAMDPSSNNVKSSSSDTSFKDYNRSSRRYSDHDRHSSNYEPSRKRYTDDHQRHIFTNNGNHFGDSNVMEMDDHRDVELLSSSRSSRRRLSRSPPRSVSRNDKSSYTILMGPDDPRELVDCRIIIVNPRQRGYGEQISSHLRCHGLVTSVILLRGDYTLTEAIEDAQNDRCLYGIIAMPMHEERHTASFHILYGQTEEHRNLTLEDGYHILLTNFDLYKERIRNEELNKSNDQNIESIIYPEPKECISQQQPITLNDKFPLSMLLCLLADGRQLTLEEIDRVLVYLLEKKAKMLTLPQGTLPPLPAQYAISESKPVSSGSDSSLSSTIAEQIRQILSSNLIKSSSLSSTDKQMSDIIQNDEKNLSQSDNNLNNPQENDSSQYHQKSQPTFSYSKSNSNSVAVVAPSFHYPSSSSASSSTISTNGNSFLTSNISSFDSIHSPLKQPTTTTSNLSSQYFYPTSSATQNLYQTLPNSAAADAAAAIFQAYSQFNARTTPIFNQQTNPQHQHIQK